MKTLSLLSALLLAVCVVGCENSELVTCQQEKEVLQGELDQANATITKKDTKIENLETENVEMQTKAMESIQVMMNKQAEKDKELEGIIDDLKAQNKMKQDRITELEIENKNLQGLCEQTKASLDIANRDREKLIKQLNDIQKAASR